MLNAIIRFSLQNRLLVLVVATLLLAIGAWQSINLPIDVFPDLNRPRVVILTEAHGMAPEEVESQITIPLETVLNGATGVVAVRSSSGVGLSVIYVEFDWGTDIYDDRQIVAERISIAQERLPQQVQPQLMPISSIMGQIMVVGMRSRSGETNAMELRTSADWIVRQRLLTIPGVSQVIVMGGERKQYQVLINPDLLRRYGVTIQDVKTALRESNENSAGGYLDEQGPTEYLVRSLGRIQTLEDLRTIVVEHREGKSIQLSQVARVIEGPQVKRGDSGAFTRGEDGKIAGGDAVVLTIQKQPSADTRQVTNEVIAALDSLSASLPEDIVIHTELYQQKSFIDLAIENVIEALRDGGILVVIVLFLFLLNLRITFITLTAIPLSIVMTALVFAAFGLSINTMTLGGIAVAIGELVDDAIVDVENIFRRFKENRRLEHPRPTLAVVYEASREVRSSIVYGTMIVVLVFIPLFALSGMEGRLFAPLGVAYIVSIVSSLIVSLTVTPVLSSFLLKNVGGSKHDDGLLLRFLKLIAGVVIQTSLKLRYLVVGVAFALIAITLGMLAALEQDFLPDFNEGAVQINVLLPPGTSLAKSNEVIEQVESRLGELDDIEAFVRRTGRAELDEHAEGVNVTEFIASIRPDTEKSRSDVIEEIDEALADIPGIVTSVEQPIAHLISHMLSGVKAQVAIKLYGDDLDRLRAEAEAMKAAISEIDGVRNLQVEQQVLIPQLRIEADGHQLRKYGLRRNEINDFVQTAMQGEVVSQVLEGQKTFDLLVRLDEPFREDIPSLKRLAIQTPSLGTIKLDDIANVYKASGPNTINREQVQRRIIVQCNVGDRGLVDVVNDIKEKLAPIERELPEGYFVDYSGQFESQQSASRLIGILFIASLVGMFMVLYKMFASVNLALQVMVAIPMAFIGAVLALVLTGQTLTIASMVGFISLCGIASRNGILLVNHYLHLVKYEGSQWNDAMIVRAGQDRLAPVLMTALTSGIGLVPLALAAGEPGKEILYPVATVIIGGLLSSTMLEFLVRPALFRLVGMGAARRVVEKQEQPRIEDLTSE